MQRAVKKLSHDDKSEIINAKITARSAIVDCCSLSVDLLCCLLAYISAVSAESNKGLLRRVSLFVRTFEMCSNFRRCSALTPRATQKYPKTNALEQTSGLHTGSSFVCSHVLLEGR